MNDNLTKIRPGNVKNFEIRCDFCGYTLKGNFVNDIVCRANDLGWKYDYENDRVICRNCQKESKMNKNKTPILTAIDKYREARATFFLEGEKIAKMICDAIRDVLPDIKGYVLEDRWHTWGTLFFESDMQHKEFLKTTIKTNRDWDNFLYILFDIFPSLIGHVNSPMSLPPEKAKEIKRRLIKLRDGK